jgi:polynucleotide 5'-kinase involved in rRNA processing
MISENSNEVDKTILVLGNSGAGKSKFSKMFTYQLLEKFEEI